MASINKQSIRDEFDNIKKEFNTQVEKGKIEVEVAALFNALLLLFNILLTVFMEKTTKKTPLNSSIPSSQTKKDETIPPDNKTNGKGVKEKKLMAKNTCTVETTTVSSVTQCDLRRVI